MFLDFSNKPSISNHIIGSVGAGNLIIQLPTEDVPVLVTINDSWLCSLSISPTLKKIGPNRFANAAYSADSKAALVLILMFRWVKSSFAKKAGNKPV
ncbi:MAG: hypothetical protein IPJ20_10310 [Flammeovirgaceae bacterium]|nr:hypothetical protein [Flammeovirgaceae bacterium]